MLVTAFLVLWVVAVGSLYLTEGATRCRRDRAHALWWEAENARRRREDRMRFARVMTDCEAWRRDIGALARVHTDHAQAEVR